MSRSHTYYHETYSIDPHVLCDRQNLQGPSALRHDDYRRADAWTCSRIHEGGQHPKVRLKAIPQPGVTVSCFVAITHCAGVGKADASSRGWFKSTKAPACWELQYTNTWFRCRWCETLGQLHKPCTAQPAGGDPLLPRLLLEFWHGVTPTAAVELFLFQFKSVY